MAYRLLFRTARLYWRIRRPDHVGAVVAVWFGERVLVLRQSYRSNPSWPGGGVHSGEEPAEAARRELREEVQIAVLPEDLSLAGEIEVEWDYRREHVFVFEMHLRRAPTIKLDNREVVDAEFLSPTLLLAREDLPPYIRAYLSGQKGRGA